MKDVAPSAELRDWFDHDPERWQEFERRYREELEERDESVEDLLSYARSGRLTLLYAASDEEHNNAEVLKRYLEERLSDG